ncbi:hypothetical protein JCM3765_007739 [Sporobolomyces pararoseus]
MFKFWKSPKTPPNPSPRDSTKSPNCNTSINNPSQTHSSTPVAAITGLGITTDGISEVVTTAQVQTRKEGKETRGEGRVQGNNTLEVPSTDTVTTRRASTSQGTVTFVDEPSGTTSTSNGRKSESGGGGRGFSSSRVSIAADRRGSYSEGHEMRNRARSPSTILATTGGGGRAISPMSFSPSIASTFHNPYGSSVAALTERDPNQIYAPTTWSDMAHQELVVNLSARERTRQEILWEVVASEERYVVELRSLVEHYTNPLLHPLLSTSPPMSSPPLHSATFTRQSLPAATASSAELPIAARFLRSSPSSLSSNSLDHLPEIRLNEKPSTTKSPPLPHHSHSRASASETHLGSSRTNGTSKNTLGGGVTSKLASLAFGRSSRQQQSPRSREPSGPPPAPPLPEALKTVLEATVEMLKGHEELSSRLKEQWTKSFPLVRGLGATWSDQPWFLQTYSAYIVSLEEALEIIDSHLPSSHPSSSTSSSNTRSPHLLFRSSSTKAQAKLDQKLTEYLQYLEKEAAIKGESSLSICLSKPLMRMSKLPLLMQALLFHTDPTTHEWEKTRAMALEVDALVRSIEDEKIEEEQRERTRDVLARIEGINDRGLMIPRSSRILISESPVPPSTSSSLPLRTASTKRSSRRVSTGSTNTFGRSSKADKEWLIKFTDVVIRAQKIGETNVPGSFSREKEKQGKQGKTRKSGPLRNTYRFLFVERWETAERAEAAFDEFHSRPAEGIDESDTEETLNYAESRMSFRYDSDEPQPTGARRDFSSPIRKTTKDSTVTGRRSVSTPAPDTAAKFGGRLRLGGGGGEDSNGVRSPTPATGHRQRFDSPTLSSTRKATPVPAVQKVERKLPAIGSGGATRDEKIKPSPPPAPPSSSSSITTIQAHSRDQSTFGLYQIWSSTQE